MADSDLLPPGYDPNTFTPTTRPMFSNQAGYTDFGPYLSMMGGGMTAGAALMQGSANAALSRSRAAMTGMQARSAVEAGAEHAELYRTHLEHTLGQQAARVGATGTTMSGSALRSLETTAQLGQRDIAQIQLNAARKAWGFSVNQAGDLAEAGWQQQAGRYQGLGALITSGARAYGQWSSGA